MLALSLVQDGDLSPLATMPELVAVGRGPRLVGEPPFPDLVALPRDHPFRRSSVVPYTGDASTMDGSTRRLRLARSRLYLVLGRMVDAHVLEPALRGGVDIVQLRDKALDDDALVAAAEPFRAACKEHGALFVLNDRPDLVEACGADGVHVGRSDTPVAQARSLVGADRLLGLSVSTLEELGDVGGADYVGVTAFTTPTKEDAVAGGLELLRAARARP